MNISDDKPLRLIALSFLTAFAALVSLALYPVRPDTIAANKVAAENPFVKHKGIYFFSKWFPEQKEFDKLNKLQTTWIAQTPAGWMADDRSMHISYWNNETQNWKSESGLRNMISQAHKNKLRVFLKPHLRLHQTTALNWRGTIDFDNEEDWQCWANNYREFILYFARLGEELKVEGFCIGTELYRQAVLHPQFWRELIAEIRQVYSGQLTYAANWDQEYEAITFWDALDFIGVQAYFPLSKKRNPSVGELQKGWQPHFQRLKDLSARFNKAIVFTELGYKSTDDAAISPWIWPEAVSLSYTNPSEATQASCYEAFFRTFWQEPWFGGAHIWHWADEITSAEIDKRISFSPQEKSAEVILVKWFQMN